MRLSKFLTSMTEMARSKGEAIKATLAWASQQKEPFSVRQLYDVYTANGGRQNTGGDNIQSFTTQIMKYVAKEHKADETPKYSKVPYWPPSEGRPLTYAIRGNRGSGDAHALIWAPNVKKPSFNAKFVNPADDEPNAGDAMDRLEKALSANRGGLPDEKQGREKLKAAIARWKGMKDINKVVADIRATIPKKAQMDALHIASEFLIDRGAADEEDVEDAEAAVAPAPVDVSDDDDDLGDFSDEPEPEDDEEEEEPDETPTPTFQRTPTAKPRQEPEEEPEEIEPDEDDDTEREAGAQNFLPTPPPAPPKPAAPAAPKKSPVSKFFKKR